MPLYPLCLDLTGRLCVVIGGGVVAARKVGALVVCDARVRLVSPELCPELRTLGQRGVIEILQRSYEAGDLTGAWLVFAATDSAQVQRSIAAEAASRGIPCNRVDAPSESSFHVPAVLRRGKLSFAVATAGLSPGLAAILKQDLAERYGEEYAVVVEIFGELRERMLARRDQGEKVPDEAVYRRLMHPELPRWIRQGQQQRLAEHFRSVLGFDPDLDLAAYLAKGAA